nr:carbohydrate ABC transporter permease [Actinopolymorpha pittospori]
MVYSSLRPADAIATGTSWSNVFSGLGLDAYQRLFSESHYGRYLGNSIVVSVISTCCTVVLSAIAGFALSRYRFRMRTSVLMLVLATQLLPFVVLITPIYLAFSEVGLLNSYLGIVVVYTAMTLPMAIYLMMGYFNAIPRGLDEAARIDGCSTLGVIFRVIVPVALPGIVTVAVTAFIATWEEFLFATVLLTNDDLKTVQVGLAGFFGEYATDWSLVMAAATVAAIPTVVLFFLVQKRLVAGMAAGSVKE